MNRGERIPLAHIMPYVEARIAAWYGGAGADAASREAPYVTNAAIRADHPEWPPSSESVPVLLLAERSGIRPGTLAEWRRAYARGDLDRSVGFFDVDGIVVALGDTGLWFRDPNLRAAREAIEAAEPRTDGPL